MKTWFSDLAWSVLAGLQKVAPWIAGVVAVLAVGLLLFMAGVGIVNTVFGDWTVTW